MSLYYWASLVTPMLKNLPAMQETTLKSWVEKIHWRGNGNPLQYSYLENSVDRGVWWAADHGVAQSRTWLKWLSMHADIGEGNGNPLKDFCLENPRDRGAWWAAIYGAAQSQTRLKQLSSSSQYPCLENPIDRAAWRATVHGVSKSWTWLGN